MTPEHFALISLGAIVQSLTFALGILVGASLRRKDSCSSKQPRLRIRHPRN
jgi:hypothetical protein